MSEEETREKNYPEIINNEEPVACVSEAPQEAAIEPIIEEEEEVKPKPKPKSRAKAKIKIVKEPVVEPVVEVVEEKPKNR